MAIANRYHPLRYPAASYRGYVAHGSEAVDFGVTSQPHNQDAISIGKMVFTQDVIAGSGIVTVADGVWATNANVGGNSYIFFDPKINKYWSYVHMAEPSGLRPGQYVYPGQVLGRVGSTGRVSPPGAKVLHMTMRSRSGIRENPEPYLREYTYLRGSVAPVPPREEPWSSTEDREKMRSLQGVAGPAIVLAAFGGVAWLLRKKR